MTQLNENIVSMSKGRDRKRSIEGIRSYIDRMLQDVSGVKALLLSKETQNILSIVYSQSELLKQDVLLTELLSNSSPNDEDILEGEQKQKLPMSAIVLARGTSENIDKIEKELKDPRFKNYHLYFTNMISDADVESLAQADTKERVRGLKEYYADYYAMDRNIFSLQISSYIPMKSGTSVNKHHRNYKRCIEGLMSVILTFETIPEIRFQKTSALASEIARDINKKIHMKEVNKMLENPTVLNARSARGSLLNHSKKGNTCNLLILDRSEDPITPLLSQWTYQAMLHELIPSGIKLNRVTSKALRGDTSKDVALSAEHDDFYKTHMYSGWGDLCLDIRDLIEEYKKQTKTKESVKSIEDLRSFIDKFPQIKSLMNQVDKHVSLVSELKERMMERNLLTLSPLEQQMVCSYHPNNHLDALKSHIYNLNMAEDEIVRLALLYCIRYEEHPNSKKLRSWLKTHTELDHDKIESIETALAIFGAKHRSNQPQLFGQTESKLKSLFNKIASAGFEVDNVYTQHKPLLVHILDQIYNQKLPQASYGVLNQAESVSADTIIFIVGGITYEEAIHVEKFNRDYPNRFVLLGGTTILNSRKFLKEVKNLHKERSLYSPV